MAPRESTMGSGPLSAVVQDLRRALLVRGATELSDARLLECFVQGKEEAAFAALVKRHGPLVWGACKRVLRHAQDAEDAFQATFLVLARKAGSIARPEALGSWLYGVAFRIASRAKAMSAKRLARESQARERNGSGHADEADWKDL